MISSDIPQYISSLDSNEPVVFYGRSGSGKSFYINDCVEGRKDILYFNVQSNEPNALWSLKEALNDRFGSDIGDNNYNEILACIESNIESINMIISDGLNDSHIDLVETLLNIQSSHFEDMKLIFIFDTERIGMKMLKMMSSYQIKL